MWDKIRDGFGYGIGFGVAFTVVHGLMVWAAGIILSGGHPTPLLH